MHSASTSNFPSSIESCVCKTVCNSLDSYHSCSFQRPEARTLGPAKILKATINIRGGALCGCSDIPVLGRASLFSSSPSYLARASGSSKVCLTCRVAATSKSWACAGEQSNRCCKNGSLIRKVLRIGSKIQSDQIGFICPGNSGFGFLVSTARDRGRESRLKAASSATLYTTTVVSVLRVGGGLAGTMELFKPHLVERVPFQFLSEYHATPRVAAAAAARRDSLNPVCLFGLGQQSKPVVEIVQAGDPVLREPAAEVSKEEIGSARIEKIINDMVATMRNAPGVGLAAPQIGIPLQIIVLEDTKEYMRSSSQEECDEQQRYPFDLLVIVNPKLKIKSGSGGAVFFEGCLSVNGYRALVERNLEVEVTGLGRDGRPISVEASGWKARILQHECDHLAGTLYVDKMIPRSFRTPDKLRLPLPSGCPKPGVCKPSTKRFAK